MGKRWPTPQSVEHAVGLLLLAEDAHEKHMQLLLAKALLQDHVLEMLTQFRKLP